MHLVRRPSHVDPQGREALYTLCGWGVCEVPVPTPGAGLPQDRHGAAGHLGWPGPSSLLLRHLLQGGPPGRGFQAWRPRPASPLRPWAPLLPAQVHSHACRPVPPAVTAGMRVSLARAHAWHHHAPSACSSRAHAASRLGALWRGPPPRAGPRPGSSVRLVWGLVARSVGARCPLSPQAALALLPWEGQRPLPLDTVPVRVPWSRGLALSSLNLFAPLTSSLHRLVAGPPGAGGRRSPGSTGSWPHPWWACLWQQEPPRACGPGTARGAWVRCSGREGMLVPGLLALPVFAPAVTWSGPSR